MGRGDVGVLDVCCIPHASPFGSLSGWYISLHHGNNGRMWVSAEKASLILSSEIEPGGF